MAEAVAKNKEAAQPLDEERVAEWLEANPGFFARHPGVLESVDLRHASGGAVSLIERQVDALRAKNIQLESRLQQLVEAARDNESRVVKVQKLARTLLRAPQG